MVRHAMSVKSLKDAELAEFQRDLVISAKLAKAIGWKDDQIHPTKLGVVVGPKTHRQFFEYKDPTILWRLAVVYDAFPTQSASLVRKEWIAICGKTPHASASFATTPELACALAIIEGSKSFKPE